MKEKSHEVSARKNNNRLRCNKKCRGGGRIPPPPPPALLGLKAMTYFSVKSKEVCGLLKPQIPKSAKTQKIQSSVHAFVTLNPVSLGALLDVLTPLPLLFLLNASPLVSL